MTIINAKLHDMYIEQRENDRSVDYPTWLKKLEDEILQDLPGRVTLLGEIHAEIANVEKIANNQ